jgi:SAM-dependent methyltransferase
MEKFLSIDEEGFISLDGTRVEASEYGQGLLENLERAEKDRFVTHWDGSRVLVEAFDEPLVAHHVERTAQGWQLIAPYSYRVAFLLESLVVDDFDRFHGLSEKNIPFVFSRQAQFEFFDLVESFDDDSITDQGKRFAMQPLSVSKESIGETRFWDEIYQTQKPGWELEEAAKPLASILPQLKLNHSKVLVLGCGSGNDAAYFAQQGHLVTAVDFSSEAIAAAKAKYGQISGLEFIQADIFDLPIKGPFDLIFEHACYAAILPERRMELINIWRKLLGPGGHLLGIFFIIAKRGGPPFGNSEWDLREKLKKGFRFLYWTRWRYSIETRLGSELVVYAQKTEPQTGTLGPVRK